MNGLQGGAIFGGNLSHPSMAFLALIVQTIMITLKQMRIDMAGIGHDKDVSDERFKVELVSKELSNFRGIMSFFQDWAPGTLTGGV